MKKRACLLSVAVAVLLGGCGRNTDILEGQVGSPDIVMEQETVEVSAPEPGNDTEEQPDEPDVDDPAEHAAVDAGNMDDGSGLTDTEEAASAVPQSLTYIDAWGEWHTNPIDTTCRMHDYKWDGLVNDGQNISFEDDTYMIRKGIDISYHQGVVDFQKVKDAGYEFVIVRVAYRGYGTTGSLNEDKMFREYIEKAQAVGLDVGVYIFSQAISEAEALEEANLVLELIKDYDLQLPVVYDPEFIRDDEARTDHISGEQFTANAIAFCEKIKEAGYEPMIYSNMIWEGEVFTMSRLQDYRFWYADYELVPQTPYAFDFWQYSGSGFVDGISGETDLDIQFIKK